MYLIEHMQPTKYVCENVKAGGIVCTTLCDLDVYTVTVYTMKLAANSDFTVHTAWSNTQYV